MQVGHLVEEARSKATSIQQSVSKALTGQSEDGFTMGMRSATPSYAPAPAWVQFLKSGALSFSPLIHPGDLRECRWVTTSITLEDQLHSAGSFFFGSQGSPQTTS